LGYVADYDRVNTVMDAIAQQFGATLPIDQQILDRSTEMVESLQNTLDALNKQKDAITTAAQLQIDAIQAAKDKAAEDAQAAIDKLQENKQAIEDAAQATITKLEEQKKAIEKAADDQIEVLTRNEMQAHADRIRDHAFYTQFLDILSNGTRAVLGDGTTIVNSNAMVESNQSQLAEMQQTNEHLETLVTKQDEQITTLKQQLVAMSAGVQQMSSQLDQVVVKLDEGNRATRRAAEGAAV